MMIANTYINAINGRHSLPKTFLEARDYNVNTILNTVQGRESAHAQGKPHKCARVCCLYIFHSMFHNYSEILPLKKKKK